MERRTVLRGLAAALASGPAIARAQGRARRIGVLMGYREGDPGAAGYVTALMKGLEALGWKEGANIHVEWRWANGDPALFASHATELQALQPDLLVAQGTPALEALRPKAGTIPIVFTMVTDPLGQGMVSSLAHPGGTITGFTDSDPSLAGKWLEMLTQLRPRVSRAAVLYNPGTAPLAAAMLQAIAEAAPPYGVTTRAMPCQDEAGIEAALAAETRDAGGGLIVLPDLFSLVHRDFIIAAAARHRLPAVYFNRPFVQSGGLMSYGVDFAEQFGRAATYLDRLLKGAHAGDLPIQQPDKFDFAVNLRTAKAIGVEIPPNMIAVADDVIE